MNTSLPRLRILAVLLSLLCISLNAERTKGASATESGAFGIVPYPDNTRHLDPGIAAPHEDAFPFFPSRASTAGREVTPDMFDLPEVCGGCHIEIYSQWKGSMHSNSWTDPVYRAALNAISKASGGKADKFCMGCHTPVGVVTGEATPSGKGMSAVADRGVQCEVCHNISKSTGIGNGAYVLTPKLYGRPLKFGPFNDAISPYHDTAYSKLHTQSEFCGQCHDVTHPFNHLPVERTYSEWRDSVYAGMGVHCQDCHMKPARGKATPFSQERERIYTHYFVGGNALVTEMLGSQTHSKRAEEMLRSAARVEIFPSKGLVAGKTNKVRLRVTNVGAGHKLPTGFPEGREMWLDFKVLTERGDVLYRLGTVKKGATEEGTQSFKVVLGDKDGNVVDLNVLDADRILYDTRIEPKGYKDVEYTFELPVHLAGKVKLVADLNYWGFSQAFLDHLLGPDAPKARIIKMASAAATVMVGRPK
ncbi:MAG TPA: cytochrome c family protein [Candidatus Methylomirabilis sp.]|nr:cytochrome c family protein [Candidatus Methylomirabilis sp.]